MFCLAGVSKQCHFLTLRRHPSTCLQGKHTQQSSVNTTHDGTVTATDKPSPTEEREIVCVCVGGVSRMPWQSTSFIGLNLANFSKTFTKTIKQSICWQLKWPHIGKSCLLTTTACPSDRLMIDYPAWVVFIMR